MPAKKRDPLNLQRTALVVLAAGAWLAFAAILRSPSEAGSAALLGYSLQRLLLAALALFSTLAFTILLFSKRDLQKVIGSTRFPLLPIAGLAFIACWLLVFLPQDRAISLFGARALYLDPIRPLLAYGLLLSAVIVIFTAIVRYKPSFSEFKTAVSKNALLIFAGFLLAWIIFKLTGLGFGFDATVWNAPGTPLLASQVSFSLGLAVLLLWLLRLAQERFGIARADLWLAALVWLLAAALWLATPAEPTYYSSMPSAPNYESYPLSDAFNHDVIVNNVLVGEGFHFGDQVAVRRPLYVMFLAGIEALLGPQLAPVISAQVIVLALFPALLFLLGSRMHSRFAGLLLAGFVTFREANSIALGHVINASHAKLLMADLPTALAMAGLALAAVAWLRKPPGRLLPALLTGGLLGAFVLLRSQTLTLIPFFVLLAVLVWGWRKAWKQAVLFVIGVVLVASPWIIRNRVQMGQWAIEDAVVSGFLANRYRFEPGTFGLPFLSGETEGEYYARQMGAVRQFASENPGYVIGFVADNFVRNQLLNFMSVPVSWQLRDAESHVRQLPYWPSWDGSIPAESVIPLLANLFFVSLGIASAWKQQRWIGLVPAFINIGFTANLALARVSGWRYNLPADWTVLFYFALGVAQLIAWIFLAFNKNKFPKNLAFSFSAPTELKPKSSAASAGRFVLAGALLALLGSSFLIIEVLSRPRYTQPTQAQAEQLYAGAQLAAGDDQTRQRLAKALFAGELYAFSGRALYPSFFRADEGVAESSFALTAPLDYRRITFFLVGPQPGPASLRVSSPDLVFPHASDVLLLRCDRSAMEVAAVIIVAEPSRLYLTTDLARTCPRLN
jgi:hypothetical protein